MVVARGWRGRYGEMSVRGQKRPAIRGGGPGDLTWGMATFGEQRRTACLRGARRTDLPTAHTHTVVAM